MRGHGIGGHQQLFCRATDTLISHIPHQCRSERECRLSVLLLERNCFEGKMAHQRRFGSLWSFRGARSGCGWGSRSLGHDEAQPAHEAFEGGLLARASPLLLVRGLHLVEGGVAERLEFFLLPPAVTKSEEVGCKQDEDESSEQRAHDDSSSFAVVHECRAGRLGGRSCRSLCLARSHRGSARRNGGESGTIASGSNLRSAYGPGATARIIVRPVGDRDVQIAHRDAAREPDIWHGSAGAGGDAISGRAGRACGGVGRPAQCGRTRVLASLAAGKQVVEDEVARAGVGLERCALAVRRRVKSSRLKREAARLAEAQQLGGHGAWRVPGLAVSPVPSLRTACRALLSPNTPGWRQKGRKAERPD